MRRLLRAGCRRRSPRRPGSNPNGPKNYRGQCPRPWRRKSASRWSRDVPPLVFGDEFVHRPAERRDGVAVEAGVDRRLPELLVGQADPAFDQALELLVDAPELADPGADRRWPQRRGLPDEEAAASRPFGQ